MSPWSSIQNGGLLPLSLVILAAQTYGDDVPSGWPKFEVESPFRVYAVDDEEGCEVPPTKANKMIDAGFTKVACPFGAVLIGATDSYPDEYILFGANVLANILDQDADGAVDDPAVVEELNYKNNYEGAMLQCGATQQEEQRGDEMLGDVFDLAFSCQTWHAWSYDDSTSQEQERIFKDVMMEEAFHMVHQNGYAVVYPDQLGMNDYTSSVVGRETARLQCAEPGWLHPENTCPGNTLRDPVNDPPLESVQGTCSDPSCNIAEFYKMVLFLLLGMGQDNDPFGPEVWLSDLMPGRREDVEALVSDEFKAMIADSELHQLQAPLTGDYDIAVVSDHEPRDDDGLDYDLDYNETDVLGTENPTNVLGTENPTDRVVCPGEPPANYCDCESDCTENPQLCACEEGMACCGDLTLAVKSDRSESLTTSSDGFVSKYRRHSGAIAFAVGAILSIPYFL